MEESDGQEGKNKTTCEIFLRHLVHLDAYFFRSINSELRVTKFEIFLKAIVNSFKILFDGSLSEIMDNKVFSFF